MTPRTELLILLLAFLLHGSKADTRYFLKMRTNASDSFKTRNDAARVLEDIATIQRNPLQGDDKFSSLENDEDDHTSSRDKYHSQTDERNPSVETSTFDPDVLNKFLEEYASKIKGTTDRDLNFTFGKGKPTQSGFYSDVKVDDDDQLPSDKPTTTDKVFEQTEKPTQDTTGSSVNLDELSQMPGDSLKRNKYWGTNSASDERNSNGWVTLDAIPWSKSKISKWQANLSTQRPWPEVKPWNKPSGTRPWQNDLPSRPLAYDHNQPSWYERPKPHWPDNNAIEKPWTKPSRPYYEDDLSNQNQQSDKWPPERPSWDSHGAHSDIITDDRPSNFPGTHPWTRPNPGNQIPMQNSDYENRRPEDNNGDWQDFPSRYDTNRRRPTNNRDRPSHFSQYQYSNGHPPTHPANGDGQWVLLSTNRGYSKSRQRSIKLDNPSVALATISPTSTIKSKDGKKKEEADDTIAVMTSKRQVRLTVLPSINGTNTTTSHGGLLEVERTFKSVDQSRKEFERDQKLSATQPTFLASRPMPAINLNRRPSNSAVLAAVGAGMLPATMAMMIPMMLGRRKRNTNDQPFHRHQQHYDRHVWTQNLKMR